MEVNELRLIHGDCLVAMDHLHDSSVDMVLADIPYGTTACKWDIVIPFKPMWRHLNRLIKPNGAIALFGSEPFSSTLRMSNIKNYKYDWIWDKVLKTGHLNAERKPMGRHEVISIFGKKINYYPIMEQGAPLHSEGVNREIKNSEVYKNQSCKYHDNKGNTLKYPNTLSIVIQKVASSKCVHSTQKPVALMEYLIKTYTKPGETVLDFTMGSGTTGVACNNLNRNFIGIELMKEHFDTAVRRTNTHQLIINGFNGNT